jgi:hypothetical protein
MGSIPGPTANRLNLGSFDLYYTDSLGTCRNAEYIRLVGGKYRTLGTCDTAAPGIIRLWMAWAPNPVFVSSPNPNEPSAWMSTTFSRLDPRISYPNHVYDWSLPTPQNYWPALRLGIRNLGPNNERSVAPNSDITVGDRMLPIVMSSGGEWGQFLLSRGHTPGVPFMQKVHIGFGVLVDMPFVLDALINYPLTHDHSMYATINSPFGTPNVPTYPLGQSIDLPVPPGKSRKILMAATTITSPWYPPASAVFTSSTLIDIKCDPCV